MPKLNPLYAQIGKMMPGAKDEAMQAGIKAMKAAKATSRGLRKKLGQDAIRSSYIARGKTPTRIGLAAGAVMGTTAMRPNANESRTSYRGPMQTGRGSGRYA